jgi:1,4-dihydroxy-2-naphthoate octaprenyltransferase
MVLGGTITCLSYSIPIFGARLKNVRLLKTFFAPASVVSAIFVPPWLREGAPAQAASAFIALAWAWCFLEFNMIVCDARDIEGDMACGISTLPSLLGVKRTRFTLAALIVITTAFALANGLVDPGNADAWLFLGAIGAVTLTTIFIESRTRRSEHFYEFLVEGMMFVPALAVAISPQY